MATKKISALTAKGANLATTDLFEISEYDGVSAYTTKSVTGANIIDKVRNVLFYANAAAFPVTGDSDTLYIAKDADTINVWNGASYAIVNPPATEKNISTNDVVFSANSTTDFAGYKATFDNAEVKIVADADTLGDVPFEITKADGTSKLVDIRADGTMYYNAGVSTNKYIYFYNTEEFTIGNNYAGAVLNMTASSSVFSTGPVYKGSDSAGSMGRITFQRGQGVKVLSDMANTGIYQTIRATEPTAFNNDEVSMWYDNGTNDLKIKFKKADGTEITKTIS